MFRNALAKKLATRLEKKGSVMAAAFVNASPQQMIDLLTRQPLCFTTAVVHHFCTKLIHCAKSGDAWLQVAKMIVEVIGFNLIRKGCKVTAVIEAASISNIKFLEFFLNTELPWTECDRIHCFMQACAHGPTETVEYLIKYGLCRITCNCTGDTPLHYLIANIPKRKKMSQRYLARLMISDGANPNALGHGGYTPFYYALKDVLEHNFDIDMMKIFIEHGATWCDERHVHKKHVLTTLTLSTSHDDLADLMISVCNHQQNAKIIDQDIALKIFKLTIRQMFAMSIYHEKILEMMFQKGFVLTAKVVYELQSMPSLTYYTPMGRCEYGINETRLTLNQEQLVRFILEQSGNNLHKFTYFHPVFANIADELRCLRKLAFCMGLHSIIGQNSRILSLDQELVREILKCI